MTTIRNCSFINIYIKKKKPQKNHKRVKGVWKEKDEEIKKIDVWICWTIRSRALRQAKVSLSSDQYFNLNKTAQ